MTRADVRTFPRARLRRSPRRDRRAADPGSGRRAGSRRWPGSGVLRTGGTGRPRYAHPLLRDAVLAGWPGAAARRRCTWRPRRRCCDAATVPRRWPGTCCGPAVGAAWASRLLLDAAARGPAGGPGRRRRRIPAPRPGGAAAAERRQRLLTELGSLEYATTDAGRRYPGWPRRSSCRHAPGPGARGRRPRHRPGRPGRGTGRRGRAARPGRPVDATTPSWRTPCGPRPTLLSDQDHGRPAGDLRWLGDAAERSPEAGRAVRPGAARAVRGHRRRLLRPGGDAPVRALLEEPAEALAEPFLLGTAAAVAQWADELDEAERLVERGLAGQSVPLAAPDARGAAEHTRGHRRPPAGSTAGPACTPPAGRRTAGPARRATRDALAVLGLVDRGRVRRAAALADTFELRDGPRLLGGEPVPVRARGAARGLR